MIKILVLLASAWLGLCFTGKYPGELTHKIVYSNGIDHSIDYYHKDFKRCLDNRALFNPSKKAYKGGNCALPGVDELTVDEKKESYDLLVNFRQEVWSGREERGHPGPQPRAKYPFPKLEYDEDLALSAWRWARECTSGVDPCTSNNGVGQTTITVWSSWEKWRKDSKISKLWNTWFNEVKHFDKKLVTNFNPDSKTLQKIGNYSQLVWGQTQKFGCAKHIGSTGTMVGVTLVCNFWPKGNIIGEPVYSKW